MQRPGATSLREEALDVGLRVGPYAAFGLGAMLEVAGVGFFGFDALVLACFALSIVGGLLCAMRGVSFAWGAACAALGSAAFAGHIALLVR